MGPINDDPKTPVGDLRIKLLKVTAGLPGFLRPQLAPVLISLDTWVRSVEARLAKLEPQPAPAVTVAAVTVEEVERERELRRLALIARSNCEDCSDG